MARGRKSKYGSIDLHQVKIAGELGLTDIEISKLLGVSEKTLNIYKKEHPEFLQSLKEGKELADEVVVRSLFKRASGYSHPDVNISNYQGNVTITPILKHYPPDPTSMIFWLKNRQPDKWKDKPIILEGDEEQELKFEGW